MSEAHPFSLMCCHAVDTDDVSTQRFIKRARRNIGSNLLRTANQRLSAGGPNAVLHRNLHGAGDFTFVRLGYFGFDNC